MEDENVEDLLELLIVACLFVIKSSANRQAGIGNKANQ